MFRLLRALLEWIFARLRAPRLPGSKRRRGKRESRSQESRSRESAPRGLLGRGRPSRAAVEIEYAPHPDGNADPGEIVWTWVPYEDDPSQGKDRPVLVVGRRAGRLVGVALTSRPSDRGDRVEVGTGAWDGQGRVSYAILDRIIDLEGASIRREGAVLDRRRFTAVTRALGRFTRTA